MKRILKFIFKGTLIVFSLLFQLALFSSMFVPSPGPITSTPSPEKITLSAEQLAARGARATELAELHKEAVANQTKYDKEKEAKEKAAKDKVAAKANDEAKLFNDLPPSIVKTVILKKLRDSESAVFGSVNVYNDRKFGKLGLVTVACGSVNSKNGFGGMAGSTNFIVLKLFYLAEIDPKRNNALFVKHWNKLCAGDDPTGPHYSDYTMSSAMVFPTE